MTLPLLSMFCPGTITYSRFGLTVYGIIPVPVFDITVNSNGLLWFRDKSHRITLEGVEPLLKSSEILVIGIGWDDVVKVESTIKDIK